MKTEETITQYTAYVETKTNKGYIQLEYGQGESLLFLVENIEDATFFEDKEHIRYELVEENCNYNKIEFFMKKIVITTEILK